MRIRVLLGVAACAATALGFATPALASPWGGASGRVRPAPNQPKKSQTFAGWQLVGSSTHATMSSTFVVPKLKCTSVKRAMAPSVGIFAGTNIFSGAEMFVGCYAGKAHYWPALVVNSHETNYTTGANARPGDTIELKVLINAKKTVVTTLDKTRKFKRTMTGTGSSTLSTPSVGEDAWGNTAKPPWGVPDFGKLTFSQTLVSGQPFGSFPTLLQWDRYKGSTLQIETSPFASDQETFKTVFKHS